MEGLKALGFMALIAAAVAIAYGVYMISYTGANPFQ